jgi:hypothetical protein
MPLQQHILILFTWASWLTTPQAARKLEHR